VGHNHFHLCRPDHGARPTRCSFPVISGARARRPTVALGILLRAMTYLRSRTTRQSASGTPFRRMFAISCYFSNHAASAERGHRMIRPHPRARACAIEPLKFRSTAMRSKALQFRWVAGQTVFCLDICRRLRSCVAHRHRVVPRFALPTCRTERADVRDASQPANAVLFGESGWNRHFRLKAVTISDFVKLAGHLAMDRGKLVGLSEPQTPQSHARPSGVIPVVLVD
jgi:hypothetical protein